MLNRPNRTFENYFVAEIKKRIKFPFTKEIKEDCTKVQFKSKSVQTDIEVTVDEKEILVRVGEYFHQHFENYIYPDQNVEDGHKTAIDQAIRLLDDFFQQRQCLIVVKGKDKPGSGYMINKNEVDEDLMEVCRDTTKKLFWEEAG